VSAQVHTIRIAGLVIERRRFDREANLLALENLLRQTACR